MAAPRFLAGPVKFAAVPGHPLPRQPHLEDRSHLASRLPKLPGSTTTPRLLTPRLLKQASNNIFVLNNQVKENTLQEVLAVTSRSRRSLSRAPGELAAPLQGYGTARKRSSSPQSGSHPAPPGKPPPLRERAADPRGHARSPPLTQTAASHLRHANPKVGGRRSPGGVLPLPTPSPGGKQGGCDEFARRLTSS